MCSIGEDDFGDEGGVHSMQPDLKLLSISDLSGVCSKCNEEPKAVKLTFREAECLNCFLFNIRHKFRATLGSSKVLPKDADVLLIFDGGPSSSTLLDMSYYAQTQSSFKRLHCNLKGLIIDDSFLGHQDDGYLDKLLKITKRYDISWYYTSVASREIPVLIENRNSTELKSLFHDVEGVYSEILASIKSLTSRQDFVSNLTKRVIQNAAKCLHCPYAFAPDISSDLATTFLTNISLGRGCSTALDIGLIDDRLDNFKLIRPVKDLTEEEIQNYVKFMNLPTVDKRSYGVGNDSMCSIQNLTKAFVDNLQEKFPSTVSTVFRTGNKTTIKNELNNKDEGETKCRLCFSILYSDNSKTLLAIEFSRVISEFAANGIHDISDMENKALIQLSLGKKQLLCHSCRNIVKDAETNPLDLLS